MIYNYSHNKSKDRSRVVPGLSISLKEAVETGAIKDTGYIPEYNDIEDTGKILGRIRDNFEAVEAMNFVSQHGKTVKSVQNEPSSSQQTSPAEG